MSKARSKTDPIEDRKKHAVAHFPVECNNRLKFISMQLTLTWPWEAVTPIRLVMTARMMDAVKMSTQVMHTWRFIGECMVNF